MKKTERLDTATKIANKIISMLEDGVSPWHKPWKCGMLPQSADGRVYRGMNLLLLGMLPYKCPRYITFRKAKEMGGQVKKGEHGHLVMYWGRELVAKTDSDGKPIVKDGKPVERMIMFVRGYTVFNVEQCEGLPDKMYEVPKSEMGDKNKRKRAGEAIWNGYKDKPSLSHGGGVAGYSVSMDAIRIPELKAFDSSDEYYSTLFHEAAHSTGHPKRLNRQMDGRFGGTKYGREELVAEIASQFLCQQIGITRTLKNSAAYCASWAKALKDIPAKSIISAAASAQRAADWITGRFTDNEKKGE